MMFTFFHLMTRLFALFIALVSLSPARVLAGALPKFNARQDTSQGPTFPSDIPSCAICAQNYQNIDSCAQAAPVLANFTQIIFNPGAFISVIECACTDTFQSAYPQCVDCFTQTNQTAFLTPSTGTATSLPAIITGIRNICAIESTLIGNASEVDGEVSGSGSAEPSPAATSVSAGVSLRVGFNGLDMKTGTGRLLPVVGLLLGGCLLWL